MIETELDPTKLDEFTRAYIDAMLWSETDGDGVPLDCNYDVRGIAPETLERIVADCQKFQTENAADIATGRIPTRTSYGTSDAEYAGHDFWLTRAGHGAGFWDGDWEEGAGDRLTDACKAFGELWPYVGDDGLIYF